MLEHLKFDWAEYSVFSITLAMSALIGIYFGFYRQQNSVMDYLLGGKKMSTFPIAMSLVSSYISGVTLLGVPTEVYTYGTQFYLANVANLFVSLITSVLFLPVFFKLQLVSLYEYLEYRFSRKVRVVASFLNALSLITFIPIVIYGPALAFNQVSGVNVHVISPIISLICIFYTTLGGLKAVVWTDALQGVVMLGAVITVAALGLDRVGGLAEVWKAAEKGDRIEFFNIDPDPTLRLSFWSATVGLTFTWTAQLAVNPGVVQRFIALPSHAKAQRSVLYLTIGVCTFALLSMTIGLIMYAAYQDCDPLTAKIISRSDQILPYFVMDVAGGVRGLPGLFIAGVVSAALSTMSTSLNTLAGTIFEDFIQPMFPSKLSDKKASFIMKMIAFITGIVCVLMVVVIEQLGGILELASSFGGMTTGASLGIFLLGILFPSANTKGAIVGGFTSLALMTWILVGNQIAVAHDLIKYPTKPMSIDGCTNVTFVTPAPMIQSSGDVFPLYKLSVFHYGLVGCLTVVVVGLIVSYLTGPLRAEDIHPDLLSPLIHRWLPKKEAYTDIPLKAPPSYIPPSPSTKVPAS